PPPANGSALRGPFRAATRGRAQYRCAMNPRVVWVIGGWCVAAVLLAAVATAGPVHLWHAPRPSAADTTTSVPVATAPAETTPPPTLASPGHVPGWIATAIEIIAIAVFVSL